VPNALTSDSLAQSVLLKVFCFFFSKKKTSFYLSS